MVNYDVDGFCEKNKDVLFVDLIEMVKGSQSKLIQTLFAGDKVGQSDGHTLTITPCNISRLKGRERSDQQRLDQRSRVRPTSWCPN